MPITIHKLSKDKFDLGESPNWFSTTNHIYQVDAFVGNIIRINVANGEAEVFKLGGTVTFVIPCASDPENTVVVSKDRQILKYNFKTKEIVELGVVESDVTDIVTRFNDAKCDKKGRLWAGTMAIETIPTVVEKNRGSLYCYSPMENDKINRKVEGVTLSNGMTWSPDNKKFYYIDTAAKTIYVYDFELETGEISNRRNLVEFDKTPGFENCGYPDGVTTDENGNLWLACYDGGKVINIDPNNCAIIQSIEFPVSKITSCCFGGDNYSDLYVTTAKRELSEEKQKIEVDAGVTFVVKGLGVKGIPLNYFQD